MNKLEEARTVIQEIDQKMIELFKLRMEASKIVAEYKKENHLPIIDEKREEALITRNKIILDDTRLEPYYLTFFEGVLKVSKDYQKELLK